MCKIELGIDTFSYYYKLTSRQKAEIIGHLKAKEGFRTEISNYGIRIWIQRIKGNPWGLLIVVHPLLVLGDSDRSTLYRPQKKAEYKRIIKQVDKLLKPIGVPCSADKMKFYCQRQ